MLYDIDITRKNRKIFESFIDRLTLEQLNKVPQGFKNSIIWNIAHTVVTQQILIYRLSNLPMNLAQDYIDRYKKGTKHETDFNQSEIDYLKSILFSTNDQIETDYLNGSFKTFTEYTVSTGSTLTNAEEAMAFNNFHEGIHLGYIMALVKSI
ncbi:MAG: DinB family protein [Winogradskyella sp.]|uniref:DinB family protein n=1 Tax=Winogradskyella sp. TaxID=1883156 RepID=UPI000F3ECD96|nr:DinB family protein [Winogradskyella sp.]RNC88355.1 MAG: DinB family protein [Winogradskyella sp.]